MIRAKRFVVVSGLPGSGKSTLGQQLAPLLRLALLDKDAFLDDLFATKGLGNSSWRRQLSRESDISFQEAAMQSDGAVLVSHWRMNGMQPDSGTPIGWLVAGTHAIVQAHCFCAPEVAAARFASRNRHAGHLDDMVAH